MHFIDFVLRRAPTYTPAGQTQEQWQRRTQGEILLVFNVVTVPEFDRGLDLGRERELVPGQWQEYTWPWAREWAGSQSRTRSQLSTCQRAGSRHVRLAVRIAGSLSDAKYSVQPAPISGGFVDCPRSPIPIEASAASLPEIWQPWEAQLKQKPHRAQLLSWHLMLKPGRCMGQSW